MVRLVNARLAPWNFTLRTRQITREEFVTMLRDAAAANNLRSYVGYANTAAHIARISQYVPALNREETKVEAGDILLCCVLKTRVRDPLKKSSGELGASDDDYEYGMIEVLA